MKLITTDILNDLSAKAAVSPRKRTNFNLHDSLEEPVHRLFNAIEPGTYVRPQRHSDPATFETVYVVRGAAVMLLFDDQGTVLDRIDLSEAGPALGVEIPAGTWHTMAALKRGTIFFEVKKGPYRPCPQEHFAPWAPSEGDSDTALFEIWYRTAQAGDIPPKRHEG